MLPRTLLLLLLCAALPTPNRAQVLLDGVIEPEYGTPLAVDPTLPSTGEGGPERSPYLDLAELYATDDGNDLMIAVTVRGDVSAHDWAKYVVFVDSPTIEGRSSGCAWPRAINARSNFQVSFWLTAGGGADFHRWNAATASWESLGLTGGSGTVGRSGNLTTLECRIPLRELGQPTSVELAVCSTANEATSPALDIIPSANGNASAWNMTSAITSTVTYRIGSANVAGGGRKASRSRAQWERSYTRALELSRAEKRPLLMYFGRQDEDRCKAVQQGILLGEPFNKRAKDFVCVYIDVVGSMSIASEFGVSRIPHITLFNRDGEKTAKFSRTIEESELMRQMDLIGTVKEAVAVPAGGSPAAIPPKPIWTSEEKQARLAAITQQRSPHYRKRMADILAAQDTTAPGGILLLGDSLTQEFPAAGAFPDLNVTNHGIGGDTVSGVLERLDVIAAARPSQIYLTIGTNDIAFTQGGIELEPFAKQYAEMLDRIASELPWARVSLATIPPVAAVQYTSQNAQIREMNARIVAMGAKRGLPVLDLYAALQDAKGDLRSEYHRDGVHFTMLGYWQWIRLVRTDVGRWEAAKALADGWATARAGSRAITLIDPAPSDNKTAKDKLVVYTPAFRAAGTDSNSWVTEAVVQGGVVVKVGGGGNTIPKDGFVVSGHDGSGWWVGNIPTGTELRIENGAVTIPHKEFGNLTAEDQAVRVLDALMAKLSQMPAAELDTLKPLFDEIEKVSSQPASPARAKALEDLLIRVAGKS